MIVTCKCLNVSLQLGNIRAQVVHVNDLNLLSNEKSHDFFSSAVAEVRDISVSKQVAALILSQTVERWTIDTCINCSLSYLAHRSKSETDRELNLISSNLIADPNTIDQLKNHANFSPVFRIVIKPALAPDSTVLNAQLAQNFLTALQKQLGEAVQKEAFKIEEAIRTFTEQQYELLQQFKDRSDKDHRALVRVIQEQLAKIKDESLISNASFTTLTTPPPTPTYLPANKPEKTASTILKHSNISRSLSLQPSPKKTRNNSFDAEGVFDLEDNLDETPHAHTSQSDPESDSDPDPDESGSHDEGIEMGLRRSQSISMAKSLPVNVLRPRRDDEEERNTNFGEIVDHKGDREQNDIAESIKAIARSLHGSTVFGDLPRPRFSTNI